MHKTTVPQTLLMCLSWFHHFSTDGNDLLKVFKANRESTEHTARRKYLVCSFEKDNTILLTSYDEFHT